MEDRRASFRMSVDWPVKITTPEESMEGKVRNVSSTGAFIQCEKPLSAKEKCLLMIELPRFETQEIHAEVVWSTASGADDESRPRGMGVKFLW
jgi:Tfp pilus assembly protein PilZ